jgi:hypothetical protein
MALSDLRFGQGLLRNKMQWAEFLQQNSLLSTRRFAGRDCAIATGSQKRFS